MKKLEKLIEGGKEIIVVEYGLNTTNHTYFSITGSMGEKRAGRKIDELVTDHGTFHYTTAGCIHDEILKHWPDMTDLVALHLSGVDGSPMYAVENGYYHYCIEGLDSAANYLRLSEDRKKDLATLMDKKPSKATFIEFVDAMRPFWKAEANAAIAKYDI